MDTAFSPSEAARETLKRLALRKLSPTPENYAEIYGEIAGNSRPKSDALARLIHDLIRNLETRHAGWTTARKRDSLERVLEAAGSDDAKLRGRLGKLISRWSGAPLDSTADTAGESVSVPDGQSDAAAGGDPPAAGRTEETAPLLRDLLSRTLRVAAGNRLVESDDLVDSCERLAEALRRAETLAEVSHGAAQLRDLWLKLEARAQERGDTIQGMGRLANMLLHNVGELVADDTWLKGQIGVMREMLAGPMDPARLKDAERRFKDVLLKQGVMRQSMDDLKVSLKNMFTTFVDRLGAMSESAGGFGEKIENYARRIQETNDLDQLDRLLREFMQDTRGTQADMVRSRDELLDSRRKVHDYEDRIRELERELSQVSEKIREDQLTHALNRRGLEESFAVEVARCDRKRAPLSLALLDIDNFKQLNDRHGHKAGDDALVHLVAVIRDTVRPSDCVARFGGEEFVILLPDTGLDEAVAIMSRVQRALTRQFFLANNERLLITFSAGVALHDGVESRDAIIARADAALYRAKGAGKNRVLAAEPPN